MRKVKFISIAWGLLLFLVITLLTISALKWKEKNMKYISFENDMTRITQEFYEGERSYPLSGENTYVMLDELFEKNLMPSKSVDGDNCNGYVMVSNNKIIEFKSFIKCNNYETKGYLVLTN